MEGVTLYLKRMSGALAGGIVIWNDYIFRVGDVDNGMWMNMDFDLGN